MLDAIVTHLDGILDDEAWADVDGSTNGLQVENSGEVDHVAFAVDACNETFDRCYEIGADMLVVHHGLFWGGMDDVTGQDYWRLRRLIEGDLALYASHLPLDAHPEVGNNARLLRKLGCEDLEGFAQVGGEDLGRIGRLPEPVDADGLVEAVEDLVGYGESDVVAAGPDRIERVAAVTGSGSDFVAEAARLGADAFVSGEPKHRAFHDAREHGITAVFAGHYHTETFGVRALMDRVDKAFDVETSFVDAPTAF